MRRIPLLSLLTALALAAGLAHPASATVSSAGTTFVGACPLTSFTLTGKSGSINELPGPMTLSLHASGSLCAVNTTLGATAILDVTLSSSSFGCFSGVASGTGGSFAATNVLTQSVGVILVNSGVTWTVFINGLPTFSGAAAGVSFPVACSLGTPAPQLTALGSLAFEDPQPPS